MPTEKMVSVQADRVLVAGCVARLESMIPAMSIRFYEHLQTIDAKAHAALKGSSAFQQRKFANLFMTFRSLKYLEGLAPMLLAMGERHRDYHRQFHQFSSSLQQALIETLQDALGEEFTPELRRAWQYVFHDVASMMHDAALPDEKERRTVGAGPGQGLERRGTWGNVRWDNDLLTAIGGEEVVRRVHQVFYDAMFDDPWIGQFFLGKPKSLLVDKVTDFMVSAFGGTHNYRGATPVISHMHMFITEEVSDLRARFLRRAILSQGLSEEIADRWLAVDRLFRPAVVKQSVDECTLLTFGQMPIVAVKPDGYQDPTLIMPAEKEKEAA